MSFHHVVVMIFTIYTHEYRSEAWFIVGGRPRELMEFDRVDSKLMLQSLFCFNIFAEIGFVVLISLFHVFFPIIYFFDKPSKPSAIMVYIFSHYGKFNKLCYCKYNNLRYSKFSKICHGKCSVSHYSKGNGICHDKYDSTYSKCGISCYGKFSIILCQIQYEMWQAQYQSTKASTFITNTVLAD